MDIDGNYTQVPQTVSLSRLTHTSLDSTNSFTVDGSIILVDGSSAPRSVLQQLRQHAPSLYITVLNFPVLFELLQHYKTLLFQSKHLIKPVKKMINTIHALNQYSQYLIRPLDPLNHDLDVSVYQNFQQDASKYTQYEGAIELAINDLKLKKPALQILVIGPGLGNLVDSVLKFYSRVTVVEKNPKVFGHLTQLNMNKWNGAADLIFDDVRNLGRSEFDLVVSEMLGSFGCNELFPEILEGIQAEIIIPSYIRCLVCPIYSRLTHNEPFLNNLVDYYQCCDVQEVWEWDNSPGLNKTAKLEMVSEVTGTINGIMGVFQADLYGEYTITNEKDYGQLRTNKYCSSWFPMVFPTQEVSVRVGERVSIEMERSSTNVVKYTWNLNGMNNQNGQFSIEI